MSTYISPYSIVLELACDSNSPVFILEELTEFTHSSVFERLINNSATPFHILKCLYQRKNQWVKRLTLNRMIPFYEEITKNLQISIEDLQEILHHENAEVRHTLKHHPQGIQLLLGRCLKHQNSLNRFLGALHPQLSSSQRKELMNSENQFDRLAIKLNPH